ncbi:hypothetical protein ACF09L_19270 [Streptomyces sp. NPDC014779]|uniref:hypothetical protein n=1 Tax=Streptomyces sp. NPDC014779 TaxID=3364911 RepID=UPI0036F9F7E2
MPVPDARVELKLNNQWTDITSHVFSGPGVQMSWGRTDEGRTVDPGSSSLVLKSPNGLYSNRNPNSPYFGLLGRNTPIRISTTMGETALDIPDGVAGRATTPDHASLDITGDLDVRVDLSPSIWGGSALGYELIGKYSVTGNQRSWRLVVTGEGQLALTWSPDGATTPEYRSDVLPLVPMHRVAVRATLDVNNGLGGVTVTFYTADTLAGPWTQLSQTVTMSGTTSIFNSSAALEVGDISNLGFTNTGRIIYAAEVRNGINGPVVANPNFAAQTVGTTSFTDSAGRTWSIANGAAITDRRVRRVHSVPHWPAHWHTSGHDQRAPIQGAGVLRRLGQGKKPLASALARRIPSRAELLAYWPCEESAGATQAYSPLPGGTPLTVSGWDFAQDNTLSGSSPLPVIAPGGTMRGTIPASASTTWALCMPYRVDGTPPAAEQEMLSWQSTGTVRRWRITMSATGTTVLGYDVLGAVVVNQGINTSGNGLFSGWVRLEFTASQSGGNVNWQIGWTKVAGTGFFITGSYAGTVGMATQIDTKFGAGLPDIRVGHVSAWSAFVIAQAYDSADHGYTAELASTRLTRLANEESTTVRVAVSEGAPSRPTEAMGPQRPKALLDLLQDCADTDGGILYEDSQSLALLYRDRVTMENQKPAMVLDYADGDVAPPFEPTESDLQLVNDITVSREGGSSARAVEEDGPLSVDAVGLYDTSISLSLATDDQAERIAGWRLHLGTWDEARFPTVRIMLHHRPDLIPAVTKLQIGDRIQIINTPEWMPPGPVDLIVQRIDDDLRALKWDVTLTCSPAGPWTIAVVDDDVRGRVGTDGSSLASGVTSSATLLSVSVTSGALWTRTASDWPFNILVGGEEMTVTAVSGASLPQTFTVTRSVNGITKAHSTGAAVRLKQPAIVAL